ncbi:MAG TPA: methyltransferase domain-containing protein [Burkholderiales bacterium]|nr:methyltransferase domain-containing protein [Burkholderiales bacterium]
MRPQERKTARQPRDDSYVPALGYDFLTRLYDPVLAATTRERTFKERLIRQAAIAPGASVLDVGCGTGTLALWIKQAQPSAQVAGLDGDPAALAIARRKIARAGVAVRFDTALSDAMPYAALSFDRVVSSLFFHHLRRDAKQRTFAEIHRVLKIGGELHIADWGLPSRPWRRLLFYPVQWLDGTETTRDNIDGHLPQLLADGGFVNVRERGIVETVFGTLALYSAERGKRGRRSEA